VVTAVVATQRRRRSSRHGAGFGRAEWRGPSCVSSFARSPCSHADARFRAEVSGYKISSRSRFPPSLSFPSFRRPAAVLPARGSALLLGHSPANAARQPYDHVHLRVHDTSHHAAVIRRLAREPTQTRPMSRWTRTTRTWARRSARAPGSAWVARKARRSGSGGLSAFLAYVRYQFLVALGWTCCRSRRRTSCYCYREGEHARLGRPRGRARTRSPHPRQCSARRCGHSNLYADNGTRSTVVWMRMSIRSRRGWWWTGRHLGRLGLRAWFGSGRARDEEMDECLSECFQRGCIP
jgi:hypothetical protein